MQLVFLGTSGMVPTKERNVTGVFLKYKAEGILFDCGEGTQRQMNIAGIKRHEVTRILISHWHADHVSGILGLMQTIGNMIENPKIEIYGPKETKERMGYLNKATYFENKVDLTIHEIWPEKGIKKIIDEKGFSVYCAKLNHNIPCLGYAFVEKDMRKINMAKAGKLGLKEGPLIGKLQKGKAVEFKGKKINPEDISTIVRGKKVAVIMDTSFCEDMLELADSSDLLVMEATFADDLAEKAEDFKHMTAKQSALVASNSNSKKLVLTHFSQRYKTVDPLLQEARDIFPETECAYDFMKIKI